MMNNGQEYHILGVGIVWAFTKAVSVYTEKTTGKLGLPHFETLQ